MNKKAISLILCCTALSLTACTNKDDINNFGEHKDTYTSIYVEQPSLIDKDKYGTDGTNTYKENEDGSLSIDMSFLEEDKNIQESDSNKTQFELNQELNGDNTSVDSDEINDKFGLYNNEITVSSVVNEITKIADRDNFSSVEVVANGESYGDYNGIIEYIVRFDTYDYYILTYHVDEGCISYHDETGYLASVYGEQVEDEEWYDEE